MEREQAARALADAGKWIMDKGLTWGNAGNLSMKLDEDHLLITASGTRLNSLTDESFTVCRLSTGQHWDGKPSKELPVHVAVYRACPWAGAVVHASPPNATLAAITGLTVRSDLFVESMYYLQRVCRIPYHHPGSADLAREVGLAAAQHNVMLLENHGTLTYDSTLAEAAMALEILENTCRLMLLAQSAGLALHPIPPETVEDFLLRSGYRPPRNWPERD